MHACLSIDPQGVSDIRGVHIELGPQQSLSFEGLEAAVQECVAQTSVPPRRPDS